MKQEQRGFTLIEVAIAVTILSIGLVSLLGLISAVMDQTVRDRERQDALLVARRVLSAIEVSETPLEAGVQTMKAGELLFDFLGVQDDKSREPDPSLDLPVRLQVEYWPLPGVENQQAIKKVLMSIQFGPSELDSLDVVYFMPELDRDAEGPE